MSSCIASSFSQGEAFISSKPLRTTTFTSSPPRRREERQQSIAVLPPPSTITRLPMRSIWPNETDGQPVDADMDVGGRFLPAGNVEIAAARRAGADEDRVEILGEQRSSGCPRAGRSAGRRRDRGCSRPPRRSRSRAGGISGSGCGSCRRRASTRRTARPRSPAAARSRATVSEAGPAPISAMRLPLPAGRARRAAGP